MEYTMSKLLSAIGIVLVLIGTVFSLWSILGTAPKDVGTAGYEEIHSISVDSFTVSDIIIV